MLRCRTLLFATVLIAISGARSYSQPVDRSSDPELTGRWEGPAVPFEGTGPLIEFSANGTVRIAAGSLVHGTWRTNGILLTHASAAPPDTVSVRVFIKGDTMIQYPSTNGDSVLLVRHDGPRGPSPIGAWSVTTPNGEESLVEYRRDGAFRLWMPFRNSPASFTVEADTVHVNGGKLSGRYQWSIIDGRLRLQWLGLGSKPVVYYSRADGR